MRKLLIVPLIVLAGCGGPAAPTKATTQMTTPQKELSSKMASMTPQERADYIKTHVDEVTAAAASGNPRAH